MPFKSEKQRKWMHANEPKMAKRWEKKKKKEALSASEFKAAHKKFKKTGELPPHLKKLVKDLDKVKVKHKVKNIVVPGLEWMSKIKEEKKRDYKAEYKKFQSSTKAKKYRAELNKYNRKKGTYGNGDGKDASHKGGKIVGFESQSKNRGRAEKSRLKKEGVITENPAAIAAGVRAAMARAKEKELAVGGGKKVKVSTALANKSHPKHKQAKGIIQRIKDKAKSMLAKSKKKKAEPKKQSKGDANFYARQFGGKVEGKIIEINGIKYSPVEEGFGGELKGADKKKFEKARKENAEVLGYKLTGKSDIKESVNEADMKAIANVVKKRQAKKIDGMLMDLTTANAVMKVYKALNRTNKKKFAELPLKKMVTVTWKLVK